MLYLPVEWNFYHYIVTFFVSRHSFWLKVYFALYKYSHSWFFGGLPFAWNIFFYPSIFSLCVSFKLKLVLIDTIINGNKLKAFPLKIQHQAKKPILTTSVQQRTESLGTENGFSKSCRIQNEHTKLSHISTHKQQTIQRGN